MTEDTNCATQNSGATNEESACFYYDVPDAKGTGSYTINVVTAAATPELTWHAWQTVESATGAPEHSSVTEANNSVSAITKSSVTVSENAAVLVGGISDSATPTFNTWTSVTERLENTETAYTTAFADDVQTAGTRNFGVTMSGTQGFKLLVVVSIAEYVPSGPTLTSVDSDNDIYPGQNGVTCVTVDMGAGTAARIVSGTKSIPMSGYDVSATAPGFDVPSLAACMGAGIDIGTTVTLEIVS
jgi:hypothetical protein